MLVDGQHTLVHVLYTVPVRLVTSASAYPLGGAIVYKYTLTQGEAKIDHTIDLVSNLRSNDSSTGD